MITFSIFYLVSLFGLFFLKDFVFFNEELLIAACMCIVFYFLVNSLRKTINFVFFFRAESIYFSFLNLISLNIKLVEKMLNLINLKRLSFETVFIYSINSIVMEFSASIIDSVKQLNLLYVRKFVYSFITWMYSFQTLPTLLGTAIFTANSGNYTTFYFDVDNSYNYITISKDEKSLVSSSTFNEIYTSLVDSFDTIDFSENTELDDILFLSEI